MNYRIFINHFNKRKLYWHFITHQSKMYCPLFKIQNSLIFLPHFGLQSFFSACAIIFVSIAQSEVKILHFWLHLIAQAWLLLQSNKNAIQSSFWLDWWRHTRAINLVLDVIAKCNPIQDHIQSSFFRPLLVGPYNRPL